MTILFDDMYNHELPMGDENYRANWIYKKIFKGWEKCQENLEHLYLDGMIRKCQLVHGKKYEGYCRNNTIATWNANDNRFEYIRHKFGKNYTDFVKHPEDDDGFDVFVPVREYFEIYNVDEN